jgi:hypothetical protein
MSKNKHILWFEFIKKYHNYFKTEEEIWKENLNKLEYYIFENKKLPLKNKDDNVKNLYIWMNTQQLNYIKNTMCKRINNLWVDFIEKYNYYFKSYDDKINKFQIYTKQHEKILSKYSENIIINYYSNNLSNEKIWKERLNKVKEYIDKNKKLPSEISNIYKTT